jgi:hypothetical protein
MNFIKGLDNYPIVTLIPLENGKTKIVIIEKQKSTTWPIEEKLIRTEIEAVEVSIKRYEEVVVQDLKAEWKEIN